MKRKNFRKVKKVRFSVQCEFLSREEFLSVEKYYDFVTVELVPHRLDVGFNHYTLYRRSSYPLMKCLLGDDFCEEFFVSLPTFVCIKEVSPR